MSRCFLTISKVAQCPRCKDPELNITKRVVHLARGTNKDLLSRVTDYECSKCFQEIHEVLPVEH